MAGPLEQFEVEPIVPIQVGTLDLSFTNASLWMVISVVLITGMLTVCMRGRALVPTRMQSLAEMFYEVIANMIRDSVGNDGRKYFPFVFSLFMFILFGNLLGMIPGSFTYTSHIIVTFGLAAVVFIGVTVIGLVRHKARFFTLFFPHGAPVWTAIILVPIELISYLSRPISLSVRLFANMTVGHLMLKVIAGFVAAMGVFGILPIAGLVAVTALEFLIAAIQAYVFAILTCIYLHDALHLH
ncbi:F0F1 ATP synthase subunit A [Fodinicurvata sp. EGI_FJ10296]|uniref:F0F1 ATP synthase subunit A n=1 Tax=Fodinicurvata sp. EGI_FJ10296 TaxID=3231908 RepID=UPI003455B98C